MPAPTDHQDQTIDAPDVPQYAASGTSLYRSDLEGRALACLVNRLPRLAGVKVTAFGGTVVLRGLVASVQEKRACVECARHVPGVSRVVDELAVSEQGTVTSRD